MIPTLGLVGLSCSGTSGPASDGGREQADGAGSDGAQVDSAGSDAQADRVVADVSAEAMDAVTDAPPASDPIVYVSGYDATIRIFRLGLAAGTLTAVGTAPGGMSPAYLAWTPDRTHLYAINEDTAGKVRAYAMDARSGALTYLAEVASGGQGTVHLTVHPSGKWLLVAHYGSGDVTVFPILPDGRLGAPSDTKKPGRNAHQIVTDPAGSYVFVPCLGSDVIVQYRFDEQKGTLIPNDPPSVATDHGPRHMAFHPTAKMAYLMSELAGTITSFHYDVATGRLSDPQSLMTKSGEDSGAHVVVSPDGHFVFGSVRRTSRVLSYAVDGMTGRLSYAGETSDDVRNPRDFGIDATGRYLVVANQDTASAVVLRIDPDKGTLVKVGVPVATAPQPAFVGVM